MVKRLLLGTLLMLCWPGSSAASIEARVDRNPVTVNESFLLTFDATGELYENPDFSPLEALFDILNQSYGNRIEMINGQVQQTRQWQLTLMAREPGTYTVPAISFGKDQSNTLSLVVNAEQSGAKAKQTGPIFLEAELSPETAYVRSQMVYKVRLYRSVNLRSANLSEPKVKGVEAIIEKLGDDRSYETRRDGVRYVVVERSYAIFPQQSGTMTVEPVVFQGQIVQGTLFSFNETPQTKRLRSETLSAEVKGVPAGASHPWLPTRQLQLVEEWPEQPPRFRVGEPVTRTVRVMADGIAATQLPELGHSLPEGLKQYPDQPLLKDQPQDNGLIGIRQEKIAIMPSRSGRFTLPAIEIPWWNTATDEQEVARIPERTIEVVSAGNTAATLAPAPVPPAADIPETTRTETAPRSAVSSGMWPWISLAFALGWTLTALLWWRQARGPRRPPAIARPAARFHDVEKACRKNDAQACKAAVLAWARSQWHETPPTSLGAVAARVDADFGEALNGLNRVLYAPDESEWNGMQFLRAAQQWLKSSRSTAVEQVSAIAPLNPR
jgi:hypothetical protein